MRELRRITITFDSKGDVELDVNYEHSGEMPTPGSKGRIRSAATLAREGLRYALEELDNGRLLWGGYGTNTKVSTDKIIVDGRSK